MPSSAATVAPFWRCALVRALHQRSGMQWEEELLGGSHWSGVLRRGSRLRLIARGNDANVAALFYNREQPLERYNMADTLKAQGRDTRVAATVDRTGKWAAQTPQMFRLGLLAPALAHAGPGVTDESSAVEALGHEPKLVRGDWENFKLTWPGDFALAERLLASKD